MECYHVDKRSLEAFSGHYVWSCCDRYTGQKSELTLKEIVQESINLKNGIVKKIISSFFINIVINLFSCLVYQRFS